MTESLPDDRYELQRRLRDAGLYHGKIDGDIGPLTSAALTAWVKALPLDDPSVRPADTIEQPLPGFTVPDWPAQKYDELVKVYGAVGSNQGRCNMPFELVLDWDKSKRLSWFTCHEKVAATLEKIFGEILSEYGEDRIVELGINEFSGCLNVRKMRGGSSWSMHAWGIAVDLDGDRNRLHETHRTARFARPEYLPMWRIIESYGATSLGRARDYDWMHWQFADL